MNTLIIICISLVFNSLISDAFHGITNSKSMIVHRSLYMKGKGSRVPINQRGEFVKRQKIQEQRELRTTTKTEGVPIFQVYVRPKVGGLWLPVGDLQGDQRSTAVLQAWMSGFMSDMYKAELDRGIARSVFGQEQAFAKNIIENYKPFKKYTTADLSFGYKIQFQGLEEKMGEQKIMVIDESMQKNWLDKAKEGFAGLFNNANKEEEPSIDLGKPNMKNLPAE